ncbi:MAG: hypothetical protein ACSW8B_01915, partial [bacterium]
AEEPAPAEYSLDEIPEYVELSQKYAEATAALEETQKALASLQSTVEELNSSIAELTNYKLSVEKEKKVKLINTFYMLSDEDKKDVLDNIDTYSLDEIEAKLSVICVRRKVSFNLDDSQDLTETTVDIDDAGAQNDSTAPAWFQRARAVEKEMSN